MIITIDGPVASGKSSVAQSLAKRLGYYYINSGLLFRAVAYLLTKKCLIPVEQLVTLAYGPLFKCLDLTKFCYVYVDGVAGVCYAGEELEPFLKTAEIDQAASLAGTNPELREIVLTIERQLAQEQNIVVDGRDTGSVVFPKADYKFYLTALPEVRSERWRNLQSKKGHDFTQEEALREIIKRDERDKTRLVAPLIVPEGAVTVDSSDMSIDEVVAYIEGFFRL